VEVNLDAARAEKEMEPKTLVVGGETFTLPVRLPLRLSRDLLAKLNDSDVDGAVSLLVGADNLDRFLDAATSDDLNTLLEQLGDLYGVAEGESPASKGSSKNTGARSRRTSKPPTS
jgi:hypothetical protein